MKPFFARIRRLKVEVSAAWLAAAAYAALGVATLRFYGLTMDEGLGNVFFGERYLLYFLSWNQKFLDFKARLDFHALTPIDAFLSPFRHMAYAFPALADTWMAACMYLFSYRLKWLNPVDGFHLLPVFLASIFLPLLYFFAAPRLGRFAALLGVLFLGTFPRFWGDMHFNPKDIPETVFFGLSILAYFTWRERPSWTRTLLVGWLFGCALGVKANAVFIPVILLAGNIPWTYRRRPWADFLVHLWRQAGKYLTMGVVAAGVYILSWPWLYDNIYRHLREYWSFIFNQAGHDAVGYWNIEPLQQVLTTIPEWMLACLLLGLAAAVLSLWRRGPGPAAPEPADQAAWIELRSRPELRQTLLAWLLIPILRASLPQATNFDGIRHFLEFLPAAALLAGYGAQQAAAWLGQRWGGRVSRQRAFQAGAAALLAVNLIQAYAVFFPYMHLYYNRLVGGFSGARTAFLGNEATDYWAGSYRQAIDWLNRNAPPGAQVRALAADWLLDLTGRVLLRPDLKVMYTAQGLDLAVLGNPAQPVYFMYVTRPKYYNSQVALAEKLGKLVYTIDVDGVTILKMVQIGGNP
jgi:hypothetical protein